MTEGFGIPIIEAQECDTPVNVTDFASMPELVHWGVAVPPDDRFWVSGPERWWAQPVWRAIRDALGHVGRMKAQCDMEQRQAVSAVIHQRPTGIR